MHLNSKILLTGFLASGDLRDYEGHYTHFTVEEAKPLPEKWRHLLKARGPECWPRHWVTALSNTPHHVMKSYFCCCCCFPQTLWWRQRSWAYFEWGCRPGCCWVEQRTGIGAGLDGGGDWGKRRGLTFVSEDPADEGLIYKGLRAYCAWLSLFTSSLSQGNSLVLTSSSPFLFQPRDRHFHRIWILVRVRGWTAGLVPTSWGLLWEGQSRLGATACGFPDSGIAFGSCTFPG